MREGLGLIPALSKCFSPQTPHHGLSPNSSFSREFCDELLTREAIRDNNMEKFQQRHLWRQNTELSAMYGNDIKNASRGGGLLVSDLAYCSEDLSLNHAGN